MDRVLPERSRRKRDAILTAATELFLENGYASTSMDDVAAAAAASKQTVYKHFRDKDALFGEIVMDSLTEVSEPFQRLIGEVEDAEDVPAALRDLAGKYIRAVTDPELLRRRRLVLREAGRRPDLARAYHAGAAGRTMQRLAEVFARLALRGELSIDDPETAATHFAYLILGRPLDTAMFCGHDSVGSASELAHTADAATDVFLAAYGPK